MIEAIFLAFGGFMVAMLAGPFATVFMMLVEDPGIEHFISAAVMTTQWWFIFIALSKITLKVFKDDV